MRKKLGFTLIELLIVVAIIAILAAIAIPNFLEAQIRAKVSRAKADMRTISIALDTYCVDFNRYPPNLDSNISFYVTPPVLTSPVAYLAARPVDPFKDKRNLSRETNPALVREESFYDYFCVISSSEYIKLSSQGVQIFIVSVDASGPLATLANRGAKQKYGAWLQWSVGPDGRFWQYSDDFLSKNPNNGLKAPAHLAWGYSFDVPYDPTNGSVSFGNIVRSAVNVEGSKPHTP